MSGCTPGPWIADTHRVCGHYDILASHRGKYGEPVYVGYVAKKRDAVAVAAVPEMLDILRDMVKDMEQTQDSGYPQISEETRLKAAKVLRRIEGGAHRASGG